MGAVPTGWSRRWATMTGARRPGSLPGRCSRAPSKGPPGWTSLDLGGVHFVVLDTNAMRDERQRAWLTDDLARAQQTPAGDLRLLS